MDALARFERAIAKLAGKQFKQFTDQELRTFLAYQYLKDGAEWDMVKETEQDEYLDRDTVITRLQTVFGFGTGYDTTTKEPYHYQAEELASILPIDKYGVHIQLRCGGRTTKWLHMNEDCIEALNKFIATNLKGNG